MVTGPGDIAVVEVTGTPRDRGRTQGEELRSLIADGVQRWEERIHRRTGTPPAEYIDRFLEASDFMPAVKRWAPDLLEEVRGIGEGANLPFKVAYAYQLMDEEWFFRFDYVRSRSGGSEHCSTLAVYGEGGPPILAQNMDLPKTYDGTQTLLRVRYPDGLESLVFTAAGLIGTTGLNNQAIGICVNSISQLGYRLQGLPVSFVIRRVLEFRSWHEATTFVQTIPHASAQNMAVGGPEQVADFECAPQGVVEFMPGQKRIYHTNRPLMHENQPLAGHGVLSLSFGKGSESEDGHDAKPLSDSEQRFLFLERGLQDESEVVTIDRVKALLSDCSVPVSVPRASAGEGVTLGSLIMELGRNPVLYLAPGPPSETAYRRWTF